MVLPYIITRGGIDSLCDRFDALKCLTVPKCRVVVYRSSVDSLRSGFARLYRFIQLACTLYGNQQSVLQSGQTLTTPYDKYDESYKDPLQMSSIRSVSEGYSLKPEPNRRARIDGCP